MDTAPIDYKIKTAGDSAIADHLQNCKHLFVPCLDETVNIHDYSVKLANLALTFEAWASTELVGLVAAYFNDTSKRNAFITNVSVLPGFAGRGIAGTLLQHCVKYARDNNFREIVLEVNQHNGPAIKLYKRHNFSETAFKGELKIMTLTLHE